MAKLRNDQRLRGKRQLIQVLQNKATDSHQLEDHKRERYVASQILIRSDTNPNLVLPKIYQSSRYMINGAPFSPKIMGRDAFTLCIKLGVSACKMRSVSATS